MAVFLINICKFNGCGITFPSLGDLIQHIEDTHIGACAISIRFLTENDGAETRVLNIECICQKAIGFAGARQLARSVDMNHIWPLSIWRWPACNQLSGSHLVCLRFRGRPAAPVRVRSGRRPWVMRVTKNCFSVFCLSDYDPKVIEQKEQAQPACLPLSYVLRFITDAAARKEAPFLNNNTTGAELKRKLAIKHHSYSMSSSNRSNTPTGKYFRMLSAFEFILRTSFSFPSFISF